MKRIIYISSITILITITPIFLLGSPTPSDPAVEAIEEFNGALLECMKNGKELGFSGRFDVLDPIMKKSFFFLYMVKKSTGSFWRQMSQEQQNEIFEKYIIWSVGTFAKRFKEYKNQRFEVISNEPFRKKYKRIVSHIINVDGENRSFEYILLQDKEKWRIIDIQIEGVSQLSFTRSQFKAVLQDKGIEGLLAELDDRIMALYENDD